MRKDMHSNLGVAAAVSPNVITDTTTGAVIDLKGFDAALLIVNTGAIAGDGDFTAKLQESDTPTGGDFGDVDVADLIGAFPASLVASNVVKVGYRGKRRYLRTVITKNGGTSIAAGAVIVKGMPAMAPVA